VVSAFSTGAVFANSSVQATATGADNWGRLAGFASEAIAEATGVATADKLYYLITPMAYGRATAYSPYFTEDAPTSDERVMILPDEGRQMELSA
jgi:hypothetical protein